MGGFRWFYRRGCVVVYVRFYGLVLCINVEIYFPRIFESVSKQTTHVVSKKRLRRAPFYAAPIQSESAEKCIFC